MSPHVDLIYYIFEICKTVFKMNVKMILKIFGLVRERANVIEKQSKFVPTFLETYFELSFSLFSLVCSRRFYSFSVKSFRKLYFSFHLFREELPVAF